MAVVSKGAAPREQRERLAAAAAAGAPSPQQVVDAFFGLKAQAEKLERIEARLERMAEAAEAGKSPTGVAALAAQQLRSVEVGSKLAATGGYAPNRGAEGGSAGQFAINILFSGGTVERITTAAGGPVQQPTIDADAEDSDGTALSAIA